MAAVATIAVAISAPIWAKIMRTAQITVEITAELRAAAEAAEAAAIAAAVAAAIEAADQASVKGTVAASQAAATGTSVVLLELERGGPNAEAAPCRRCPSLASTSLNGGLGIAREAPLAIPDDTVAIGTRRDVGVRAYAVKENGAAGRGKRHARGGERPAVLLPRRGGDARDLGGMQIGLARDAKGAGHDGRGEAIVSEGGGRGGNEARRRSKRGAHSTLGRQTAARRRPSRLVGQPPATDAAAANAGASAIGSRGEHAPQVRAAGEWQPRGWPRGWP